MQRSRLIGFVAARHKFVSKILKGKQYWKWVAKRTDALCCSICKTYNMFRFLSTIYRIKQRYITTFNVELVECDITKIKFKKI